MNISQSIKPGQLKKVEWLAELLDMSMDQTYDAIREKFIPENCVFRVGRRIRLIEPKVMAWIGGEA